LLLHKIETHFVPCPSIISHVRVLESAQPCMFIHRYHSGDVYIIDVSQAVEHDHPHALEFLRKDCANVNGECTALECLF